jgi:ribosomal protein L29
VALGMLVVPNTDRINTFRRLIARGTVRRARAPRHATYADAASRASP